MLNMKYLIAWMDGNNKNEKNEKERQLELNSNVTIDKTIEKIKEL